jgi:hypothetical protein
MLQQESTAKVEVTLRISSDLIAAVDRIRKRSGATRTEWLRRAISATTVIFTLMEEIEEAIDHTLQIYTPARQSEAQSMEDLIEAWDSQIDTASPITFPDAWLENTTKELMQQAERELNMLPVNELHQLIDEERGEQRQERIILRYVGAAMQAADQFIITSEEAIL